MENPIIIFTSNIGGGISQFAVKLAETFSNNNKDPILMAPENYEYEEEVNKLSNIKFVSYKKIKTLNYKSNNELLEIAEKIVKYNPIFVIYADSSILSLQVADLVGNKLKQAVVIHDINPHPSKFSLSNNIKNKYQSILFRKTLDIFKVVICLSRSTSTIFTKKFPEYKGKSVVVPLGAHLIISNNKQVKDKKNIYDKNYLLFFGRIDKYKGIKILLKAYILDYDNKFPKLLIAGKGSLSRSEEKLLVKLGDKVEFLNKYISEEDMVELFYNSMLLVLPYIEASQSGVLPIAYQFGKPVIASDLPGLSEYIVNKKTGLLFKSKDSKDLYNCIELLISNKSEYENFRINAKRYYDTNLNWNINVKKLFNIIYK